MTNELDWLNGTDDQKLEQQPAVMPTGRRTVHQQVQDLLQHAAVSHPENANLTRKPTGYAHHKFEDAGVHESDLAIGSRSGEDHPQGWVPFLRELYADLLEGGIPQLDEIPEYAKWADKVHGELDSVGEYREMRALCQDDPEWSQVAMGRIASEVLNRIPNEAQQDPEAIQGLADDARASGAEDLADALEQAAQAEAQRVQEDLAQMDGNEAAMRNAVRRVAAAASEEIANTESVLKALGGGRGTDFNPAKQTDGDIKDKLALAEEIAKRPELVQIAEIAGRLLQHARALKTATVRPAVGAVVDVKRSDDIARLTPSELCRLASPALAPTFFRDHAESQLLTYEMEGDGKAGKGPVVLLVDISGSMTCGSPSRDSWAKGVIVAVASQCREDKRHLAVGHYNYGLAKFTLHSTPPRPTDVLAELRVEASGGTSVHKAMDDAEEKINQIPSMDVADYIIVTDGQDDRPAALDDVLKAGRQVYGVFVDCGAPKWAQDLSGYCELTDAQIAKGEDAGAAATVFGGALKK
uniref:Putative von Willebrand factor A domain-containing protein n=1 Tax=viral metagenome TaxID=1070528 RepID=A0A6M3M0G0_9ZZZZ